MTAQDYLTLAAFLLFSLSFAAFWIGVFWFGRMVSRLEATVDRLEAGAVTADASRSSMQHGIDRLEREGASVARGRTVIADNLADSVSRADATEGEPGEAADAALRTGDTAAAITQRQDDARP